MFELLLQIDSLAQQLQGATAMNVYMLYKQGGQLTIDKEEMLRINAEFGNLAYSMDNDKLVIKLSSVEVVK